jgi:formylglycine-generating enzyme required for sulfatase activity
VGVISKGLRVVLSARVPTTRLTDRSLVGGITGSGLIITFVALTLAAIECAHFVGRPHLGTMFRDCDECPEMVVVPPGTFIIGDSVFGHPQHQVTIGPAFAVAKDMITRREFREFVTETGYSANRS